MRKIKNNYGKSIFLENWQNQAIETLKGNNGGILVAPTGAGKTVVAYGWAGLFNEEEIKAKRVIFTAPTKALSNERFKELRKNFDNVGIITGDVKFNCHAKILCMTMEIYTNAFADNPNQLVIIDEVHYIYDSRERARAYIEGIAKTNPESKMLLLSATINLDTFKNYIEKVSRRKFVAYEHKQRPVQLDFIKDEVSIDWLIKQKLTPAIVFVFSYRGVNGIANGLYNLLDEYPEIQKLDKHKIEKIAGKYKINKEKDIFHYAIAGIGIYHGNLLYKEKIFIEQLAREKLLHFIVATDSLALGINLPVKTVIFAQLHKYYSESAISKREFLQMAGRAGRKGLDKQGYVGFIASPYEAWEVDTQEEYLELLDKDISNECPEVILQPSIKKVITGETTVEKEAEFVAQMSSADIDIEYVVYEIEAELNIIEDVVSESSDPTKTIKPTFPNS
jgi:superfamily II RNA helicase